MSVVRRSEIEEDMEEEMGQEGDGERGRWEKEGVEREEWWRGEEKGKETESFRKRDREKETDRERGR